MSALLNPSFRSGVLLTDYMYLAATMIVLYDHAITLSDEVEVVWKRPSRPWIFYLHRYFAVANMVGMSALQYIRKQETCKFLTTIDNVLLVVSQGLVGLILLLRTRALYGGDRRILWFGLGTAIVLLGLCSGIFFLNTSEPARIYFPNSVCTLLPLSRYAAIVSSLPWMGLLVFDITIMSLTVRKTMRTARAVKISITSIMLRDGALYFCAMAACNLANILSVIIAPHVFHRGSLALLTSGVSVTLASRLMLNLFQAGQVNVPGGTSTSLPEIEFLDMDGTDYTMDTSRSRHTEGVVHSA